MRKFYSNSMYKDLFVPCNTIRCSWTLSFPLPSARARMPFTIWGPTSEYSQHAINNCMHNSLGRKKNINSACTIYTI